MSSKMEITIVSAERTTSFVKSGEDKDVLRVNYVAIQQGWPSVKAQVDVPWTPLMMCTGERLVFDAVVADVAMRRKVEDQAQFVRSLAGKTMEVEVGP